MYYFLPVFLCFLGAQLGILGLLKSYGTLKYSPRRNVVIVKPKEKRTEADGLDFELLTMRSDILPCSQISFCSDDIQFNFDNPQHNAGYASALFRSLLMGDVAGADFDSLKCHLINLFKTQFYSGGAPEFYNGGKYITGGGTGAATMPYAAAQYINYTGDDGILNQSICYNALCKKPLCNITATDYCETVYEHIIKALNIFEAMGGEAGSKTLFSEYLTKEESGVLTEILYCMSAEAFLPYLTDYGYKISLIEKLQKIKNSGRKKAEALIKKSKKDSGEYCRAIMLYVLHGGEKSKNYLYEILKADNGEFTAIPPILHILTLSCLITEYGYCGNIKNRLDTLTGTALDNTETALLRGLVLRDILGITFKKGHMAVNPRCGAYTACFKYNGNNIKIDYGKRYSGGISVDGLLFNNIDYIPVKGYNKDINIML